MLERPDVGDAGNAGDAGEVCEDAEDVGGDGGDCLGRFARYLQFCLKVGQRGISSPSQGQGGRGCFGVQVFWAGLRAGDAGNAEELGVQQNTSAVYPTGRVFELEDTQRSWICLLVFGCFPLLVLKGVYYWTYVFVFVQGALARDFDEPCLTANMSDPWSPEAKLG